MVLRSMDEDFDEKQRKEQEVTDLRDALRQASLDLMNLSAFLRLEGHAEMADIGDKMHKAALAAATKR